MGLKRSFSGIKWKKNLGKLRAEQFFFYPLLCVLSGMKWNSSAAGSERSGEVQKRKLSSSK